MSFFADLCQNRIQGAQPLTLSSNIRAWIMGTLFWSNVFAGPQHAMPAVQPKSEIESGGIQGMSCCTALG